MKRLFEKLREANIKLPSGFKMPAWDPVEVLDRWNAELSPQDGVDHWDGNAVLGNDGMGPVVRFVVLPRERATGVDRVTITVADSGVVSLQFEIGSNSYPMCAVSSHDEMFGMLRVLRVLREGRPGRPSRAAK